MNNVDTFYLLDFAWSLSTSLWKFSFPLTCPIKQFHSIDSKSSLNIIDRFSELQQDSAQQNQLYPRLVGINKS